MSKPYLPNLKSWPVITLEADSKGGYIIAVDSGGTPSTTDESLWDGDIPWLTPKEITQNINTIIVSTTERCISAAGLAQSAAKLFPPGTVMLTKRAPVGAVSVNAVPMCTNQGFLNFQCGEKLRPLYLAYWLKINTTYLQQVANGSTYRELYKSDLFEFEVAVPSVAEQDAILAVITSLQYVEFLGIPLEQSAPSIESVLSIQNHNRRLHSQCSEIIAKLLSGAIDLKKLHGLTKEVLNA